MSTENHKSYMRWAVALALEGQGRTSPNPLVGAVVVKNGTIVGEGFHRRAGTPHAEVNALKEAGRRAKGADLYVTLEPCAHFGRTPPCVEAIAGAGIKRAFIGTRDPNPIVSGRGISLLRRKGLKVICGVLEESCRKINEAYNKFITTGMPFVTVKVALSLDGKIAAAGGDSKWITNKACRDYVHKLRSLADAVVVGANTALTDDPLLNVRLKGFAGSHPKAVIVDEKIALPASSRVLKRAKGEVIIATGEKTSVRKARLIEKKGHVVLKCETKNGRVSIQDMLDRLGKMGITSILVEGGGEIFADFFKHNLVDRAVLCIAPKLIGGGGKNFLPGISLPRVGAAISLTDVSIQKFGDNVVVEGGVKANPKLETRNRIEIQITKLKKICLSR